jgi:hypothetical protein
MAFGSGSKQKHKCERDMRMSFCGNPLAELLTPCCRFFVLSYETCVWANLLPGEMLPKHILLSHQPLIWLCMARSAAAAGAGWNQWLSGGWLAALAAAGIPLRQLRLCDGSVVPGEPED